VSVHVVSWVLRSSPERLGRRLVLLVLADHAKEDGTAAWPSVETIAEQARLSERQARRALRELELAGAIEQTGRSSKGTNVYTVKMTGGGQNDPPAEADIPDLNLSEMSPDPPGPTPTASPIGEAARADGAAPVGTPQSAGDGEDVVAPPSTSSEVDVAGAPQTVVDAATGELVAVAPSRTAQDVVRVLVDRFEPLGVVIPPRHRGMIASQAKELLDAGMDFGDVVLSAIVAVRRGTPQHVHYIAGDVGVAKAGQRITRRQYERELEDAVELRDGAA